MEPNLCDDAKISTKINSTTAAPITSFITNTHGVWSDNYPNCSQSNFSMINTSSNIMGMGPSELVSLSTKNTNTTSRLSQKMLGDCGYPTECIIPRKYQYDVLMNEGVSEFSELSLYPKKPNHRAEMLWLLEVTDEMLREAGVDEKHLDVAIEQKGSQMEKFIYLINQEKEVYNRVFCEVICQVSIECRERGLLLTELRRRYASLLQRVPQQVMGLHQELLNQRAIARHTVETFREFKSTTGKLLNELKKITKEINIIRSGATQLKNTPGNSTVYFNSVQAEIEDQILKLEKETNDWENEEHMPKELEYIMPEEILEHDGNSSDECSTPKKVLTGERHICVTGLENKHRHTEEEDTGYTALELALSRLKRAEERAAEAEEKICEMQLRINLLDKSSCAGTNDVKT